MLYAQTIYVGHRRIYVCCVGGGALDQAAIGVDDPSAVRGFELAT
jgi:hypothetical protein